MEDNLSAACEAAGISKDFVLDHKNYEDRIVVVTKGGQKFSFDGDAIIQTTGPALPAVIVEQAQPEEAPESEADDNDNDDNIGDVELDIPEDLTCRVEGCRRDGNPYKKEADYIAHVHSKHPELAGKGGDA